MSMRKVEGASASEGLVSQSDSSFHESESGDDEFHEDKVYDCKADVYWLMSIRILHFADRRGFQLHKSEYIIGLAHSILVYGLCIGLQLLITAFLMLAAARIEVEYHSKFTQTNGLTLEEANVLMKTALSTGEKLASSTQEESKWKTGILAECEDQLHVRYEWIYVVMIFVWVLNMLIEFRDVVGDITVLLNMARNKGERMFAEDGFTVTSLTRGARWWCLILGPGVRFLVAVALLFAGCKVLYFRQSMMFVVLCSMSLGFVVSIDDLVIGALAGPITTKELEDLKLSYTQRITRIHNQWNSGLGGLTHLVGCLVFAALYVYVTETTITQFREECWAYHFAHEDELAPKKVMLTFSQMFHAMVEHMFDGIKLW